LGSVSVFNEHSRHQGIKKRPLVALVRSVFQTENVPFRYINVILVEAGHLLEMNRQFLHHDFDTDVITFPLQENGPVEGEIYISLDQAKTQATEFNVTFENELNRLVVHGCLHLCGYNDETEKEIQMMRKKEEFFLLASGS